MNAAFLVAAALLLGPATQTRVGAAIEHAITVDSAEASATGAVTDVSSRDKKRAGKAHRAHKHHAHKHQGRKHHARRHHGRTHHVIYVRGSAKRCWVYHPLVGTFNRCTPRGRVLWWRLKHGLY
jgi:hypothetical protein